MRIAIVGAGAIGSTLALHLARAGHEVSVVARGARLAQLTADGAIVTSGGERVTVTVCPALAPEQAYDLVLVTVLAAQVDAVLPALKASAAKTVMFMFNTFGGLGTLRDAVGRERFCWGFPAVVATLAGGRLATQVVPRIAQVTTVGALPDFTPGAVATWARVFSQAGIPTVIEPDMEAWLCSHAAFMVPLMVTGVRAHAKGRGLRWGEAREVATGLRAAFALVRRLGHRVTPVGIALLGRLPRALVTVMFWCASRVSTVKALGATGDAEPRALLDAMLRADPTATELRALR